MYRISQRSAMREKLDRTGSTKKAKNGKQRDLDLGQIRVLFKGFSFLFFFINI